MFILFRSSKSLGPSGSHVRTEPKQKHAHSWTLLRPSCSSRQRSKSCVYFLPSTSPCSLDPDTGRHFLLYVNTRDTTVRYRPIGLYVITSTKPERSFNACVTAVRPGRAGDRPGLFSRPWCRPKVVMGLHALCCMTSELSPQSRWPSVVLGLYRVSKNK